MAVKRISFQKSHWSEAILKNISYIQALEDTKFSRNNFSVLSRSSTFAVWETFAAKEKTRLLFLIRFLNLDSATANFIHAPQYFFRSSTSIVERGWRFRWKTVSIIDNRVLEKHFKKKLSLSLESSSKC